MASGVTSTLADLTANVRRTAGLRPPPLLDTLEWTLLWPKNEGSSSERGPAERYFHTAQAWGSKLVVFGGETYALPPRESPVPPASGGSSTNNNHGDEDGGPVLVALGDVCVWDTVTSEWSFPEPQAAPGTTLPEHRYAHLAVICRTFDSHDEEKDTNIMMVIGGQNVQNAYLESVHLLDLDTMVWTASSSWDKHLGSYRAVATTNDWQVEKSNAIWPATRSAESAVLKAANTGTFKLSRSVRTTRKDPCPVMLFSNFNFSAVRREIEVFPAPVDTSYTFDSTPLNRAIEAASLPPGLRFPDGAIVGRHLVVFGTHLAPNANVLCIWALDLGEDGPHGIAARAARGEKLAWQRVDPGSVLARGSWNRGVVWKNSLVVLGDRERDLAADYDHRQINFAHVAFVDLEAFGVYQPPVQYQTDEAQQLGLAMLDEPALSDFEVVCCDGRRLACSRKILEERWPWFADKLDDFHERAKSLAQAQRKRSEDSTGTPEISSLVKELEAVGIDSKAVQDGAASPTLVIEPRISPRTLNLPERSEVAQAFLQYLYTRNLVTPLQLAIPVLTSLLLFAKTYHEGHLLTLVTHALHEALSAAPVSAGTIYEAATLANCIGLQIRSLRSMMIRGAAARMTGGQGSLSAAAMLRRDTDASATSSQGEHPLRVTGAGLGIGRSYPSKA